MFLPRKSTADLIPYFYLTCGETHSHAASEWRKKLLNIASTRRKQAKKKISYFSSFSFFLLLLLLWINLFPDDLFNFFPSPLLHHSAYLTHFKTFYFGSLYAAFPCPSFLLPLLLNSLTLNTCCMRWLLWLLFVMKSNFVCARESVCGDDACEVSFWWFIWL